MCPGVFSLLHHFLSMSEMLQFLRSQKVNTACKWPYGPPKIFTESLELVEQGSFCIRFQGSNFLPMNNFQSQSKLPFF